MVHLSSHFIHAPRGTVQGNLLREPEHQQFVVPVELDIRSEDIVHVLKSKPLETALVIFGKFLDLFHRPFPVQESMEVGKQDSNFKTGSLEVDQFVDRDEVAEVDLAAWLITGIDSFRGL